jgi:hypothetical protein
MIRIDSVGATAWRRLGRSRGVLAGTMVLSATALALSASPAFAGLRGEFAKFSDCPVNNPAVVTCVVSTTTSGEFHLGSKTVPVTQAVVLQGGLQDENPVLVPAADGNTLSKTPLQVPGGIVGIEVLGPLTEVTATAELAGQVELNVANANEGHGVGAVLPVKVKLGNTLLGEECYVGSNSEPVDLMLTTGATNPPAPNTSIHGSTGSPKVVGQGKIVEITGSSLVDNSFAAPGANGCAGLLAPVVDEGVDVDTGLPSAAGTNTAILNGTLAAAGVRSVVGVAKLPELGRCEKLTGVKEGKTVTYHGGYVDSGCIEEDTAHGSRYEWHPGAAAAHFTTSSGAVTLETVGKAKVKCAASQGSGEYTGAKSATLGVTLTGCKAEAGKQACSSAGASEGEIVASGLAATLGFVEANETEGVVKDVVGWDLAHEPSLIAAQCGASKEALTVTGSVIAPVSAVDKMLASYTLKAKATKGKQSPEEFEEEPKDTLSASFAGGAAEQAGLTASVKVGDEEKLEFKAEVEE